MANQVLSQTNSALEQQINLQIANWTVLYTKLHHFHWYVKGPNFFTLHEKFEELYTEAAGYMDELAERLLAIGGKPVATLKETLSTASVKEAEGTLSAEQMVTAVVEDYRLMAAQLKEGILAAEEAGDEASADLLLGIQTALDKHIWMLSAYIANE
ncbi:DNA starvation/stationary phase protection protein [Paenibacillus zeisoli]|uniref:DNA starvation/stationary phase protection protein n=1 Tax=Paenibacillus zeisoli TaxID=2496267 RepID=A0A433X924_9BACL|nr:Dps family protein [Paenibacillus zeisoli]RUT30595.1 DNA starvation/stationary phase protection protein [Paenibacillus zeisoli]